jgi:hypothetical protein
VHDDAAIVELIVDRLKRNGLDRDETRTRGAVRDAIRHVRVVLDLDPAELPPVPTMAVIRKAWRVLGPILGRPLPEGWWREPPPRTDGIKYKAAAETYDLVALWTNELPTGWHEGPFFMIAPMIYCAAMELPYIDDGPDLRRQCGAVLKSRRNTTRR